jgi:hypothetical protein
MAAYTGDRWVFQKLLTRYTAARRSWGTARHWSSSDLISLLARVQAEAVRTSDQRPTDAHLVDKAVIAASRWLDGDLLADAQTVWLAERACHQAIWRSTVMGADRAAVVPVSCFTIERRT